jgi:Domain of unknown function (DUF1788)
MTVSLSSFSFDSSLDSAIEALRKDLLTENSPLLERVAHGGNPQDRARPQISTMRNYHFAILRYDPREEFKLRSQVRRLSDELKGKGWNVLSISLQQLLIKRLQEEEQRVIESIIRTEKRLHQRDPDRALNHLKDKIACYVEGVDGIAQDVITLVNEFAQQYPDSCDRTLIFIGRTGALYPFFRSSALLKYIDGRTRNIPMVLLYPGERKDTSALSFMGEVSTDRDYRPRIY